MANIRVLAGNVSPTRVTADGGYIGARGTRDGAIYVADFLMGTGLEGRVFAANQGTLSTPIATAATSGITTLRPMAWVRVPDATLIVPLYCSIVVESCGATTQGEISVATIQADVGNGTSTAGGTPVCLNAAATVTSNCSTRNLATADVSSEAGLLEITRFSFAASAVNQRYTWDAKSTGVFMSLRGPATWSVYIGGNAVNFYATQVWLELPESFGN